MSGTEAHPGAADFDFFIGSWRVAHHRLKERLAGCTEWADFGGSCVTRKLLGGLGNWWLDGRNPGSLDPPMVGRFADGVGRFCAEDALAGRPIRERFLWTTSRPGQPRWEHAFSPDGGPSWETNCVMDFTRADAPQVTPVAG